MIQNPIITGFSGDPSIVRVGEDYYIATSSFEWFPGVAIYHSRDLKHWRQIDFALKTREQLDLTGVKPSGGVWAPDLSYNEKEKRFYLLYSNVHSKNNWFFDVDNYLIWSEDIHGPWSEPVYLNSSGFDASLFHDEDGRKWIASKDRDFRTENIDKRAIVVQEYDPEEKRLTGPSYAICQGATERRFVEGPHIYKRNGWYYLMTAEGGTGYGHCVALLRSKAITGPYEGCPYNPIITSQPEDFSASETLDTFMMTDRFNPDSLLQKSGHGSLVETQTGEWYVVHLCGRPVLPKLRCVLGRETSIQKMKWTEDEWLVMEDGSRLAKIQVPEAKLPEHPWEPEPLVYDFNEGELPLCFQAPRNEITPDWADVTSRPGYLRLRGRESLTSNYYPSLLARRLTAFHAQIETKLVYRPESYHHRAGLTCYYDLSDHYYLYETFDEALKQPVLMVGVYMDRKVVDLDSKIPVEAGAPVWLRGDIARENLQFSYSLDGEHYTEIGPKLDMTILSDEAGRYGRFTGTYVGMFAQDCHTKSKWAEFDWFRYETFEEQG